MCRPLPRLLREGALPLPLPLLLLLLLEPRLGLGLTMVALWDEEVGWRSDNFQSAQVLVLLGRGQRVCAL